MDATIEFLMRNSISDQIWDVIQDAKSNKIDLSVVWLDLANAYVSVPHELLFKSMDHFHIPDKVKTLMNKYYNSFVMRFTTVIIQLTGIVSKLELQLDVQFQSSGSF